MQHCGYLTVGLCSIGRNYNPCYCSYGFILGNRCSRRIQQNKRAKERERSHAVLKKNCVAFLHLKKEGVIWDFEQRMK